MNIYTTNSCPIEPFEIKFKDGVPETLKEKLSDLITGVVLGYKIPELKIEFFLKIGDAPVYTTGNCGPHLARFYYPVDENNVPLYQFSEMGINAFRLRTQDLPESCGFKVVIRHPDDASKGFPVFEVETIHSEGAAAIHGTRFDAHMKSLAHFMADYRFVVLKEED